MEGRELRRGVATSIEQRRFGEAEGLLLQARTELLAGQDRSMVDFVFSELIALYCIMEPPNLERAEELSLEREVLDRSAQSKLQTSMLFYWSRHDPSRALSKLHEAIEAGERQGDSGTVYSSLSLPGLALLDLGRINDAASVLDRLEQMVTGGDAFVPGDETLFLERGFGVGLDVSQIRRIASSLIPICRDPEFVKRLHELATRRPVLR